MNYATGDPIKVGDRVRMDADQNGKVVCDIEAGVYTAEHPKEQWGYLERGVMIEFPLYGLIHMLKPEEGLELVSRNGD